MLSLITGCGIKELEFYVEKHLSCTVETILTMKGYLQGISVMLKGKQSWIIKGGYYETLSDLNGRKMFARQYNVSLDSNKFEMDLSGCAKGIYLLHVRMNGSNLSKKLVIW